MANEEKDLKEEKDLRYVSTVRNMVARPRSKRLRELGVQGAILSTAKSGGGYSGGSSSGVVGDGHYHANKSTLDKQSDADGYLYLSALVASGEDEYERIEEKVKAGYADEADKAGHAKEADHAKLADKAKDLTDDSPVYNRFLRKDQNDITTGKLETEKYFVTHQGLETCGFTQGSTGAGIYRDEQGNWHIEGDYFNVRRKLTAEEIEIQKTSHIGGKLMLTAASMECIKVEEGEDYYRCYMRTEDSDGIKIHNQFKEGDQALVETFNLVGENGNLRNHFLWRPVIKSGTDYIDLSKKDYAIGSEVPLAGDHIVQLGYRGTDDAERQNAIIMAGAGDGSPYLKQYTGIGASINHFTLPAEETRFKPGDNKLSGQVHIQDGSTGWKNIKGLPEEFDNLASGAVNLIRNSGFTGNYELADLCEADKLKSETQLFSPGMEFWEGNGAVVEDGESRSGHSCTLSHQYILQVLNNLITGENYILSFRAKGELAVSFGSLSENVSSAGYERFVFKKIRAVSPSHTLHISGLGSICEIQLERGTIASDWNTNPLDNDKSLSEFLSIKYLTDAIKNADTKILGGLILSNIINLGNYANGEMKSVTSGISGIYNDNDDVAFWAGGNMEKAIKTAMTFAEDPSKELSDEEWKNLANVVITHGGRGIFNDVILRGYIHALGGVFKGTVYATDGEFKGKVYATDGEFKGKVIADKGSIGKFNIEGNAISSTGDGYILIEKNKQGGVSSSKYGVFTSEEVTTGFYGTSSAEIRMCSNDFQHVLIGTRYNISNSGAGGFNYAFNGIGDGVLNGMIDGYKVYEKTLTHLYELLHLQKTTTGGKAGGNRLIIYSEENGRSVILPNLTDVLLNLNERKGTPFALRYTIIAGKKDGSQSHFKVYGRHNLSDVAGKTNDYPRLTNNNGGNEVNKELGIGDILELMLVYDGTPADSLTEYSYQAYILGHRN